MNNKEVYQSIRQQLKQLDKEIKAATKVLSPLDSKRAKLLNALKKLEQEDPIEVTDHALVRWLQRVHGVDIASLKNAMITDEAAIAILSGDSKVEIPNGTLCVSQIRTVL